MIVGRRATTRRIAGVVYRAAAAALLLGLGCGAASAAQSSRTVYLPMTFHAEARPLRTSACLRVTERAYPQSAWWDDPAADATPAERAFKAVIAAVKSKNRDALFNLSDPAQGRDPARFDKQAAAFFEQFSTLEMTAVPLEYEFDGLALFFAKFRFRGKTFYAPLAFAYGSDGTPGFLPYRTEQLTYFLVRDWFDAPWGPNSTDAPSYCTDEEVKRATFRVALADPPAGTPKQAWGPSYLLFSGASLDAPGQSAGLTARIKSTSAQLNASLAGRPEDLIKHMTPEGGNRLKEWLASAEESERRQYMSAVMDRHPFFVIDASPLLVVYTRSSAGAVNVMYFTTAADNTLLWTNSSHITLSDKVFKHGLMYDSALSDKPFANSAIK
jgi:hypothetical protein